MKEQQILVSEPIKDINKCLDSFVYLKCGNFYVCDINLCAAYCWWASVTDTKAIGHSGPAGAPVWTGSELGIRQDRWLESHYGEGVFHPNTDTPLNVINNTGRGNKTGD